MKSPNTILPSSEHNLRRLVGAGVAALALSVSGNASEQAQASHDPDNSYAPVETSYFPKPSSLEGYDKPLRPEAKEMLRSSTVKIAARYSGGEWNSSLTGVKVRTPTGDHIFTSAHGFTDLSGADKDGLVNGPKEQAPAYNYIERAQNRDIEYAIFDPNVPKHERKPIAMVTGISISNRNQDQAALSVQPVLPETDRGPSRSFEEITAVPLATEQLNAVPRPMRGQRVSVLGIPEATGHRPVAGLGRYLGRIRIPAFHGGTQILDVVGIKPKTEAEDNCNYGASGSIYTATSKKGGTYASGSLAARINDKWDPSKIDSWDDFTDQRGDITNELSAIKERKALYESLLKVNLNSFSTICGFTVNLPKTAHDLVYDGFSSMAPPEEIHGDIGKGGSDK